jgi:hypothetical protein
MPSTFEWGEDYGASTGSPAKGTTRVVPVPNDNTGQLNWKNAGDSGVTDFTTSPIQAGNRSFDKHQFGKWSGTFNQIIADRWGHTGGTPGSGITIKGKVGATYRTPATTDNTALDVDITTPVAIGSGLVYQVGATGPEAAGKGANTTSNPAFSDWLTTQLHTTSEAAPGNIGTMTFTIRWDEN